MIFPRIIISSDRSNSGKTVITSGIIRALTRKFKVRAYKVGPDFIDPKYLKVASYAQAINLDLWLMGEDGVRKTLLKYAKGFDIGILEGVMGLYDGVDSNYSTYELSKVTETPIVVVINCSNLASTAGAIVKGLKEYGNANVRGVIFNQVGSITHLNYCKRAIPDDITVLGHINFDKSLTIPSRHLGLYTTEDFKKAEEIIQYTSKLVEENIDLDKLIEISNDAGELEDDIVEDLNSEEKGVAYVALDPAFNFYYEANFDFLRKKYRIEYFSPLNNDSPNTYADLIYIGGGYPELHLSELSNSYLTKEWIRKNLEKGAKILGECGGLMYLSKELVDTDDKSYRMVDIFDISIKTKDKLTIGYTELEPKIPNFLTSRTIRGHEFHVSKPIDIGRDVRFAFKNKIGKGIWDGNDGAIVQNGIGLYSHLYFSGVGGLLPL
ncbi:cobyrinate a,c-diamide synthase [Stygiolobus caldivivus]|uniref:Cobyrinate a,c-diamide synthase n=1 Tax=Stygiolobus caldivivus TaxID=2824673 RepID=A0A8D5U827_9CREN|nr:cobyrinate a,c-diamide synthase [Stygiolobus caldivivus]BCU70687.1 cobyrinic acid a,c-diamide synthase [Stygiolobus caldivivus]